MHREFSHDCSGRSRRSGDSGTDGRENRSRAEGIAARLIRRVEEEAVDSGFSQFYLYTPDQQGLYRRLGWQELEELSYRGEAVTIMLRQLEA